MHRAYFTTGGVVLGFFLAAGAFLLLGPPPSSTLELRGYQYQIPDGEGASDAISSAIALRSAQLVKQAIQMDVDDQSLVLSATEWGYSVDEDLVRERAEAGLNDSSTPYTSNMSLWLSRRFSFTSPSYSIPIELELDETKAGVVLARVAARVERPARDAQLLVSEHKILPSQYGLRLSVPATIVRMKALELDGYAVLSAVTELIRPHVTEEDLAPVDVTKVLATYETSFRGKAGARAVNIRTAGRLLDGAIVLPGEILSFNERVGRRIHGRGFVDAPVIVNDELELDVGGGVCQVATTLHAAAVFGNLEVVRRRSHSRPSGYAPLGLDATVIDGEVDLRIRNSFDEPLLVHVSFPSRYKIRVELLGRDPDAQVDHAYRVTHREPYSRRVWHRNDVPLGGFEKKQKGSEGMDVVSVLRIQHDDGSQVRRSYRSKYYPVPEVFWLGEGAASTVLPEMPEDAVALVVDGEDVGINSDLPEPRPEETVPPINEVHRPQRPLR